MFNPMDILIYAVIAGFLAWRLYSTLGTRHEDGRTRPNPFSAPEDKSGNAPQKDLLALPLELPAPKPRENPLRALTGPAPQSLSGTLYAISDADPSFEEKSFLKGARMAFEMIVHAFAASEREALKNLMSPVLSDAFIAAIDAREKAGERVEMKLLNLIEAHITDARIDGKFGYVTVEFVSDQARAHYLNDQITEDEKPARLTDVWTFRRELGSPNPNWMLVETRSV